MATKTDAAQTDITKMSEQQIKDHLRQRKAEQVKLVHENGIKARAELEAYCLDKYKMTLVQIFTATKKAPQTKLYRHPETGQTYSYTGRGKLPAWCKPEYLVN
jgi:hypothetical protein